MDYSMYFTFLLCFSAIFKDAVSVTTWNMPRPVVGYHSYLDVSPLKYNVAPGLSHMNLSFHSARNDRSCADKMIHILIQHNGLPLVKQTNISFPENFVVGDGPTLMFSVRLEQLVGFSIVRPPPGAWFVIAYYDEGDKKITQKGLDSDVKCVYSFISRLEIGKSVVSTTIDLGLSHEVTIGKQGTLFSFTVPVSTQNFDVVVEKCDPEPCNITLRYVPFQLTSSEAEVCDGPAKDCQLRVPSPPLNDLCFIDISYHGPLLNQTVTFSVTARECPYILSLVASKSKCIAVAPLDRIQSTEAFTTMFGFLNNNVVSFSVDALLAPIIIIPFEIIDPNDIGGSLKWQMQLANFTETQDEFVIEVCGALLYNYLPNTDGDFDVCTNVSESIRHLFRWKSKSESTQFVPYPRIGQWHVVLQARCLDDKSGSRLPCPFDVYLDMALATHGCVEDECSDKGTCQLNAVGSDMVAYSACKCDADYQGFACTDDTNAQSMAVQLAGAYLLTLSNLFFIPSIFISVKRRFFVEAFVYFYNMFFSTFYHACDGVRLEKYRMCIMKYDVLQAADFFGSACSLWFTLVAMARIRYRYITPLLQIMGPFGILIGIVYDRTSLCVIAVPIFTGLVALAGSWGHKMYVRKKLYPGWRRYVFFLLPGLALAAVGASVFSFLETESNYKYVHSVWHACIALCILFLLPPRKDDYGRKMGRKTLSNHSLTDMADGEDPFHPRGETNPSYDGP